MAITVSSIQNPTVKEIRSLYTKKGRRDAGLTVVEGVHPLEEVLLAGWPVATVLYTERFADTPEGADLVARLMAAGAWTIAVEENVLERVAETETPQGILGTVAPRFQSVTDLARGGAAHGPAHGKAAGATGAVGVPVRGPAHGPAHGKAAGAAGHVAGGLLLVCDGLQDPGNLGTLWRAAHAFGARGLILTSNTVEPFSPKVIRAASGSVFHLPVAVEPDPAVALAALRQAGVKVAVADSARGDAPDRQKLTGALAMVIGSEAAGPAEVWLRGAEMRLRVPMPGRAESLNAGVAGSILLYEVARQHSAELRQM
ncbi:MAG: TrmH family RNA methyltransferase [Symbiobacteriia bacterium]